MSHEKLLAEARLVPEDLLVQKLADALEDETASDSSPDELVSILRIEVQRLTDRLRITETELMIVQELAELRKQPVDDREPKDIDWMDREDALAHYAAAMANFSRAVDELVVLRAENKTLTTRIGFVTDQLQKAETSVMAYQRANEASRAYLTDAAIALNASIVAFTRP